MDCRENCCNNMTCRVWQWRKAGPNEYNCRTSTSGTGPCPPPDPSLRLGDWGTEVHYAHSPSTPSPTPPPGDDVDDTPR